MKQTDVEVDRLRIWDFYLTFPNEARKISFPQHLSGLKKVFKSKVENPYEDLIDPRKVFERMQAYQTSALRCLASYGFIDNEQLGRSIVKRTAKPLPQELTDIFRLNTPEKQNIINLVIGFSDVILTGRTGLKFRTGLLDFKYDPR